MKNFEEQNVDTSNVSFSDMCTTGVAAVCIDNHGENQIIVVGGSNNELTPTKVIAASDTIRSSKVLLLQNEIPLGSTLEALKIGKASGCISIWNNAPAVPDLEAALPLLYLTTILVVNEMEAATLSSIEVTDYGNVY